MSEDKIDYFQTKGVYKRIGSDDEYLFVCLPLASAALGKLVQYKTDTPNKFDSVYENTDVSFLLNCYDISDIRSLFVDIENYELVGCIGNNFELSEDKRYLKHNGLGHK